MSLVIAVLSGTRRARRNETSDVVPREATCATMTREAEARLVEQGHLPESETAKPAGRRGWLEALLRLSSAVGWGLVLAGLDLVREEALLFLFQCSNFRAHDIGFFGLFVIASLLAAGPWWLLHGILVVLRYRITGSIPRLFWLPWALVPTLAAVVALLAPMNKGVTSKGVCY